VGFIDPKKEDGGGGALPGASGIYLDLDLKRCPACRRELTPWQERCPDCGEVGVAAGAVAPDRFPLPHLALEDEEPETGDTQGDERHTEAGGSDADEGR
jgi:rRNA maturation protein Nop10